MACCYIAAFCINQLIKTCQFLDIASGIKYNEENDEGWIHPASPTTTDPKREDSLVQRTPSSLVLSLDGLTCSACVEAVEKTIMKLPAVGKVRVSLTLQQVTVVATRDEILDEAQVVQAIRNIGYEAEVGPRSPKEIIELLKSEESTRRLATTFSHLGRCITVLEVFSFWLYLMPAKLTVLGNLRWFIHLASMSVMIYVQCYPARWIHKDGWKCLRGGPLNMSTLTSLSMMLACILPCMDFFIVGGLYRRSSYTMAAGLCLVVVAGKYIDGVSRRSATSNLAHMYKPIVQTEFATLFPEMIVSGTPK